MLADDVPDDVVEMFDTIGVSDENQMKSVFCIQLKHLSQEGFNIVLEPFTESPFSIFIIAVYDFQRNSNMNDIITDTFQLLRLTKCCIAKEWGKSIFSASFIYWTYDQI